jgi:N-acetylglucosamine-6-sulfatase
LRTNLTSRQRVPRRGYITDEPTDYALEWMRTVPRERPFFLYLSHKAAHADFTPAERHADRYHGKTRPAPRSRTQHKDAPMWVRNQRNSWHGVDFAYPRMLDIDTYHQRYCVTLLAVDESVGRLMDELRARGQLENTLIAYMGDNGLAFGEHGLIDKRTAYEWSMRVPLIAFCPAALPAGATVERLIANLDIAPTLLEAAGLDAPAGIDGRSFWPLVRGEAALSGGRICSTNILGSKTIRRRRHFTPCAASATNTSTCTASGASMNSTTCRRIPRRRATSSSAPRMPPSRAT